jgi:hypothetical protein
VIGWRFCRQPRECHLYPFREGKNLFRPVRAKKEPTEAQLIAREKFKARTQSASLASNFASSPKAGAKSGADKDSHEK